MHYSHVTLSVDFHDDFVAEFHAFPEDVQDELLACVTLLEQFGPLLGRPRADTRFDAHVTSVKKPKDKNRKS